MSPTPLSSVDAGERAQFMRLAFQLGLPAFFLLNTLAAWLVMRQRISPTAGLILAILSVPLTVAIVLGAWRLTSGAASGLVAMLYGAGNLPPDPQHSSQESLVARGFYAEAAESFLAHLATNPGDNAARIKLGTLCREHLGDSARAEQLYLEVRQHHPTPRQEALIANLLIELYRSTGQRGRHMVELARYAERYRGTRAGQDAARLLKEMKREGTDSPG